MKKLIGIMFIALCLNLNAQQEFNFYYAGGEKVFLRNDSTSINIIIPQENVRTTFVNQLKLVFADKDDTISVDSDDNNIIIISSRLPKINIDSLVNTIRGHSSDSIFWCYAKRTNKNRIWFTNKVYVLLKDSLNRDFIYGSLSDYDNLVCLFLI